MSAGAAALAVARLMAASRCTHEAIQAQLEEYAAVLPGWPADHAALEQLADAAVAEDELSRADAARAMAPDVARATAACLAAGGATLDQISRQLAEMMITMPYWIDLDQVDTIAGEAFRAFAPAARAS